MCRKIRCDEEFYKVLGFWPYVAGYSAANMPPRAVIPPGSNMRCRSCQAQQRQGKIRVSQTQTRRECFGGTRMTDHTIGVGADSRQQKQSTGKIVRTGTAHALQLCSRAVCVMPCVRNGTERNGTEREQLYVFMPSVRVSV